MKSDHTKTAWVSRGCSILKFAILICILQFPWGMTQSQTISRSGDITNPMIFPSFPIVYLLKYAYYLLSQVPKAEMTCQMGLCDFWTSIALITIVK